MRERAEAGLDGGGETGFGGGEGRPVVRWHTASLARIPDKLCPVAPSDSWLDPNVAEHARAPYRWRVSVTCVTVAYPLHGTDLFCVGDRR
ncbi:hypothetical protein GCM10017771_22460 [Streptomyces capitiformicae]|uniref:Uncharacterized protein n=1 Tax=Streptomyces capitiformicae TaxID=2014920 RepID=A0A919L7G2_9ACTN|nr:hypothetical protein GCM10017771_22460 [Streptomyces capitiformicae]